MRQRDLRFTFHAPSCSQDFEVVEFTLEEELSQPFRLRVELACRSSSVDFEQLLDRPASLTLWQSQSPVRQVHGIVTQLTQGTTGFERTRYRVVVEPQLARLALSSDWGIFQNQTVPDILKNVLDQHGVLDYQPSIHQVHETREYCVQAGDTDLGFLDRLASEEGLVYYFRFEKESHTLVHTDRLFVQPRIEGGPVRYNGQPVGANPEPVIYGFSYTENVRTARQSQNDYTFTRPALDQRLQAEGEVLGHQGDAAERYDYPGRYKRREPGSAFTRDRLRGHRRDAQVATIKGDDPRLLPGLSFQLIDHPRADFNRVWRPVRIVHTGVQTLSGEDEAAYADQGVTYDYVAEIISEDVEWRPAPAARPRIDGPQIATVVGPEGEEIHTDEWGRVKIKFPWDRLGKADAFATCWIRVAQGWAGSDWGHQAIPRVGQEVIVAYLDGDCDQPIVIGRTYRAGNRPPYSLPEHKALSTLKSREYRGSRANELRLDDTPGQISAALMSDHGASHLHLGYLTHPRPQGGTPRGEGFELRTDERGAIRAAKGLLLSTEAQLGGLGGHLQRETVIQVLEAALRLAQGLGDDARRHLGLGPDTTAQAALDDAVRTLGQGANDEGQGGAEGPPAMALFAPAGIAVTSPASITLAAGEHLDSVAQRNQQFVAGQQVTINAGTDLGLFAHGGELRQIAQQGPMLLQAQHDSIRVQADQSVEISASQEHLTLAAQKHITLLCGGAYLTLKDGNIELGMPGTFTVKASQHSLVGPAQASTVFDAWDRSSYDERVRVTRNGKPLPHYRYALVRADGARQEGVTDGEGWAQMQRGLVAEGYEFQLLGPGDAP